VSRSIDGDRSGSLGGAARVTIQKP
jgi:hypothetical protein